MKLDTSLKASMNARIIGSGSDTIILAHGFGGEQSIWDLVVPTLSKQHSVLLFDWNFSGAAKDPSAFDSVKYASMDSFAKDLIGLLDEMKLSSSVFIGHSMSGMIGCLASIRRPDLFKRLILVGASPRYLNSEGYEGGFEMPHIEEIFINIESNFEVWAAHFASLVVDANDPFSVDKFRKSLCRMRPEVALSVAKTIFCSDVRTSLDKVHVPCTIVQTSNDIVVPNSVAYYMQKKINGGAQFEMIEADGHFPQLTNSEQLLEVFNRVLSVDAQGEEALPVDSFV